jgi:hypothetical protein
VTTAVVLVVGGIVTLAVLYAIAAANPGGAERVESLVPSGSSTLDAGRPTRLVEWEGLVLAGTTSGARGRARLGRHIEPLVAAALRDGHGLSIDDPRAATLLGDEWAFLQGGPPPAGRRTDPEAVVAATARLLDRLEDRRSGTGA